MKRMIYPPKRDKSLLEIIIDIISGRGKKKSILDWFEENKF